MSNLALSFLLGLTAAVANLVGAVVVIERDWRHQYLKYFVALGSGFMLATALLEMVPEGLRQSGAESLALVLAGYLLVHFFEHSITAHFHFGEEVHPEELIHPRVAYTAGLGMLIHTFFDGVAIASGFIVSAYLGAVIFLAVFLHKIPDGFTLASVMMASGRGPRQAMGAAGLMGVATLAGVAAMWLLRAEVAHGLLLSAGATLYVAASDLMPEVNREPGILMALWVFVGVALMVALRWLMPV